MEARHDDTAGSSAELIAGSSSTIKEDTSSSSTTVAVKLAGNDIPGAELEEPLETHGVPALQWWLLCRGIKAPSSWRKSQLIDR